MRFPIPSTWVLGGLAYCIAVVVLDWVSSIGLYRGIGVTPWSPATGLTLAFAFVFGRHAWIYVMAAETLSLILSGPALFALPTTVFVAIATSIVWLTCSSALRGLGEFDPRLRTVRSLLYLLLVGLSGAMVHAAIYIGSLWTSGLIGQAAVFPAAWRLVVGDLVGILVVTPLPLMLSAGWRPPRPSWVHLVQLIVLAAAVWTVFAYREATSYQLFYLLFLPLLWVALRDGVGGASVILNAAQIGIIIGAQMRMDITPGAGSLQTLMIALTITGLLVGAVVTERESAGQRLREQQAALGRALRLRSAGETAAAIAHQINQPITAISTYATVAKEALDSGNRELAGTALVKLSDECERAAAVMRSIRDLVKQGVLTRAPVRLNALIEDLRIIHADECTSRGIVMSIDIPSTLPNLFADRVQLEQAVDNLIVNSIESIRETGKPGRIRISAKAEKEDTHIEIEDDGPGFAPGFDAIATTPFMTTKLNGSGLGLAIARSVAEAHGGSLAVKPRSAGACVCLRLPTTGRDDDQGHKHH